MTRMLLGLVVLTSAVGCASLDEKKVSVPPPEQVYSAGFDQVWRATQLAMARYPRKVDDMEAGILETETLKGDQAWTPPFETQQKPSGYRQKIQIRVIKGDSSSKSAVKVVVTKSAELLRSFFAEPQALPTDGLEERLILYRIDREIKLDQMLHRSTKRGKKGDMELDEE